MNRMTTFKGAGLVAAMCCLAVASVSSAGKEKRPAVDRDKYNHFMANEVGDVYELERYFFEGQTFFLPILPPAEDFILRQPGSPAVIPFDSKAFPTEFVEGLSPVFENSVPVYPVTILEDPNTRETVFLNADGKELYALPPAPGYDPYAYLRSLMPSLYSGRYTSDEVFGWRKLYDPSRVRIEAKLIPIESVEPYLYVCERIAEEAERARLEKDAEPAMQMRSLDFAVIEWNVAGGDLALEWTPEGPDNYHAVERSLTLASPSWTPAHWSRFETNWIGSTSANGPAQAFYRVVEFEAWWAEADACGSGLTAFQEYLLGTDPTKRDTSGDGIPDGAAVLAGADPLRNALDDAVVTVDYEYDEFDRLMAVSSAAFTLNLDHDDAGNVSVTSVDGGTP